MPFEKNVSGKPKRETKGAVNKTKGIKRNYK